MDMYRVGSEITVDLEKKEDAIGLYAVMTGKQNEVPPEVWERGQRIYSWLFQNVEKLAVNYETETNPPTRKKNRPR